MKSDPALLFPGALRHRLTFLVRSVTVRSGKTAEAWNPAFSVWGSAEPLTGREFYQAAAVNREQEVRFTVRYRAEITPDMRIALRGEVYEITAIANPGMRNVKLEIIGKAVNGGVHNGGNPA